MTIILKRGLGLGTLAALLLSGAVALAGGRVTLNFNPDWKQAMKVFERQVRHGESLTLGSNTENPRLNACNMYLLFVKRQ